MLSLRTWTAGSTDTAADNADNTRHG
jgi:hypothetical protein